MPTEITMPQQSDTMTEGTVVKWRKKEGDRVKSGEVIAEIETDKAVMEIESFDAGTLAAVVVQEGAKVPVGAVIAVLATGKENPADVKKQYAAKAGAGGAAAKASTGPAASAAGGNATAGAATAPAAGRKSGTMTAGSERVPPPAAHHGTVQTIEGASVGELHEPDEAGHGATREAATAVPPVRHSNNNGGGSDGGGGNGHRVLASPLARRIAADKGLDLSQIQGSGPNGRIVQRDVLSFAEQPRQPETPEAGQAAPPAGPARVSRGEKQVVPLTKMRGAIAAALQKSKQTVPHFYESIDIDVEELSTLRVRLNKQLESEGVKISLADFVAKAVAVALLKHPAVNAHWTGDSITRFGDVHLGLAVAIPDGLIVPVLRNVDQMGLKEIRVRSAELVKKAQAQPPRLKQDEMKGATFTISNLGQWGIKEFSAIINPPEVAILAVAAAEKRAVVRGDQIVARTMMTVTLSADHRAVDGATAADFLRTLKGLLEEPGMMLV